MNTINLITLGILCQSRFNLEPGFRIMQIPSDFRGKYRIAYPPLLFDRSILEFSKVCYEDIELLQLGFIDNAEKIWVGYSEKANVLIYQDRSGTVDKQEPK